jgi:DNA-binding XRE family transcriptional regulator
MKITMAAARKNAGMTQGEAAEKIGVSRQTVMNWETQKTDLKASDFLKICEIYKVEPTDILFCDVN